MRTKSISLAAACIFAANTTFAGSLAPTIEEAPVVVPVAEPEPSINPVYVVVGVLAALLIAAAASD